MRYDALKQPEPARWLSLDEQERVILIERYHRRVHDRVPNLVLHATIHAMVENQIALELEPVVDTLARLLSEGLDRHDAVHAIGSVLTESMFEAVGEGSSGEPPMPRYYERLTGLTADSWRSGS